MDRRLREKRDSLRRFMLKYFLGWKVYVHGLALARLVHVHHDESFAGKVKSATKSVNEHSEDSD